MVLILLNMNAQKEKDTEGFGSLKYRDCTTRMDNVDSFLGAFV